MEWPVTGVTGHLRLKPAPCRTAAAVAAWRAAPPAAGSAAFGDTGLTPGGTGSYRIGLRRTRQGLISGLFLAGDCRTYPNR
jgi:hypothetical protein